MSIKKEIDIKVAFKRLHNAIALYRAKQIDDEELDERIAELTKQVSE